MYISVRYPTGAGADERLEDYGQNTLDINTGTLSDELDVPVFFLINISIRRLLNSYQILFIFPILNH